jgi:hypothetical protein
MSRIWNTFPQLSGDSARFIEKDRIDVFRFGQLAKYCLNDPDSPRVVRVFRGNRSLSSTLSIRRASSGKA